MTPLLRAPRRLMAAILAMMPVTAALSAGATIKVKHHSEPPVTVPAPQVVRSGATRCAPEYTELTGARASYALALPIGDVVARMYRDFRLDIVRVDKEGEESRATLSRRLGPRNDDGDLIVTIPTGFLDPGLRYKLELYGIGNGQQQIVDWFLVRAPARRHVGAEPQTLQVAAITNPCGSKGTGL